MEIISSSSPPISSNHSKISREGSAISIQSSSSDAAVVVSEEDDRDDDTDDDDDNNHHVIRNIKLPAPLRLSQRTTSLDQARQTQHRSRQHHQQQEQQEQQQRRRRSHHLPQSPTTTTTTTRRHSSSSSPAVVSRTRRHRSSRKDWMNFDRNEPDWDSSMDTTTLTRDEVAVQEEDNTTPSQALVHPPDVSAATLPLALALPFALFCGVSPPTEGSPLAHRTHRKQQSKGRRNSHNSRTSKSANRQTALMDDDLSKAYEGYSSDNPAVIMPSPPISRLALAAKENSLPPPPTTTTLSNSDKFVLASAFEPYGRNLVTSDGDEPTPRGMPSHLPPSPSRIAASDEEFLELQHELAHLRKRVKKKTKDINIKPDDESHIAVCDVQEKQKLASNTPPVKKEDVVMEERKSVRFSQPLADTPPCAKKEDVVVVVMEERKSVRFAKPIVTKMVYRPKTTPDEINDLFFQEDELEALELDRETTTHERFECVVVESAATHYHVAVKHNLARRRRGGSGNDDEEEESTTSSRASSKLVTRFHI